MKEDQSCFRGRYENGRYIVSKSAENAERLIDWIKQTRFKNFEKECYLSQHTGRPRNKVYFFRAELGHDMWVMKVSHIAPQYRLSRKIDLFITGLYKDYAKNAFLGAKALYDCGVPVARPLAFWTYRTSLLNKQSYFLCHQAAGQQTVAQWLAKRQPNALIGDDTAAPTAKLKSSSGGAGAVPTAKPLHTLAVKIVDIVRRIHRCNLRHGDIHLGNLNMVVSDSDRREDAEGDLSEARFCLLDYDDCSPVKVRWRWIKRFFDLRDLHNLRIPGIGDEELLTLYFGNAPDPHWLRVLRFWRNGGFSLRRHLGFGDGREGRHLKP